MQQHPFFQVLTLLSFPSSLLLSSSLLLILLHVFLCSPNTLVSFIPISPLHTSLSRLYGCITKKTLFPPGCLSRSDVVSWEEWRRCIHESRWCSPQERNRRVGGNRGVSKKAGRRARNERKLKRKGRWRRETDEEGECERGQIDEWMFEQTMARQMPIYYTKCFKLKRCLEKKSRDGVHSDSKLSLVFIFKSLRSGVWTRRNKLNKLFKHYPSDYLHTAKTLHSIKTIIYLQITAELKLSNRSCMLSSSAAMVDLTRASWKFKLSFAGRRLPAFI